MTASLPELIGERYRPQRLLGRGGGGAVYEVEHTHTGARLALKVLSGYEDASPEAVARFRREARLAAAIDSEHVVRITDAGMAHELGGAPFIVMELMHGHTLEREAKQLIAPEDVVTLLAQVARGLERAHVHGIVHRDLKPDNLFVTRRDDGSPCIKVLDFGIAKRAGDVAHEGSTAQGTVLGTPMYMAPEQALGHGELVDARTDTWALGLIAFRMLFGRPYFQPDAVLRMLNRVAFEPIVAPSMIGCHASPAFDAWFLRSCDREIEKRFHSPITQIEALRAALAGVTSVSVDATASLQAGVTAPATPVGRVTPPASGERSGLGTYGFGSAAAASVPSPQPRAARAKWFVVGACLSLVPLVALSVALLGGRKSADPPEAAPSAPALVLPAQPVARPAQAATPSHEPDAGAAGVLEPPAALAPLSAPGASPPVPARVRVPRAPQPHRPVTESPAYDPLGDQR